jgi:DNA-binding transcriptional MerR regulator
VPSHVPLYPMRTVVRLTQVEAHRIRFWERRYGLVNPVRDESGRRLFSKKDVDRIREIGTLVDKHGLSLLAIRRLLCEQVA